MGILVVILGLALYFNKPLAKDLKFDIACREFAAPVPVQLKLHQGPTDLRAIGARGFDGALRNVASLKFAEESQPMRSVALQSFRLEGSGDPNQAPPDLELAPHGDAGKAELSLDPGAVLKGAGGPGLKPVVSVESMQRGDVRLLLGSGTVTLHGNRYRIPEIASQSLVKSFSAEAAGEYLAGVELVSEAPASPDPDSEPARPSLDLTLNQDPGDLPLLAATGRKQDQVSLNSGRDGAELSFTGALNPDLRVEDKTLPGLLADRAVNLQIQVDSGWIESITLSGSPEKRNSPALNVKGTLRTHSVLQDGHEILPTVLDEVLDEPYSVRGPLLIALGFLAFAVLKTVDRALGVLLEIYLPKGD